MRFQEEESRMNFELRPGALGSEEKSGKIRGKAVPAIT
jgi:hypothetical protein